MNDPSKFDRQSVSQSVRGLTVSDCEAAVRKLDD